MVGHGVAAGMLMATARGTLRSRCQIPGTLAEMLTHLNNQLIDDIGGDRFMTMMLMTIDAKRINRELACFLGGKSPGDDLRFVIVKVK